MLPDLRLRLTLIARLLLRLRWQSSLQRRVPCKKDAM